MIGRLFRRYLITAWAPTRFSDGSSFLAPCGKGAECVCASACALIWFGAVDRDGVVGLHRPRLDDPTFKALPPDEATKVYRHVLDDIARYLDEMEAPRPMIDAMVATGSSEIRWVDAETDRLKRPPSYAEWTDATCGEFTAPENKKLEVLGAIPTSNRTSDEALFYKLLSDKEVAVRSCKMALRFSHVEAL